MNYLSKLIGIVCLILLFTAGCVWAGEIHIAAAAGDLNKVRALLEDDSTLLESRDSDGNTPLIIACWGPPSNTPQSAVANYLIDKGADINAKNSRGGTSLFFATKNFDLCQRLIAKGADVNIRAYDDYTPLHQAAFRGNLRAAKLLIDHGADVNFRGRIGTAIQRIINTKTESGTEMVKLLLENGAKLQKFSFGNTELHLAAINGDAEIIPVLVKYGADVNAANDYGHTPLYYAAMHGHRKTAEALIAAGAKKSAIIEANYGTSPQLSEKLKQGEAYLWYLGGVSPGIGYAVKTKKHLLLFNPPEIDDSPEAGLANGRLNPNELVRQKVTAFILYPSYQPRSGPSVSDLGEKIHGINVVLNFKPKIDSSGDNEIPSYHLAMPHDDFSLNGIRVHTIPAAGQVWFSSEGLGYLVETDGVKIFHAGLHVTGKNPSDIEKYRKEIDYLKPFGPIDIVILPVNGRHVWWIDYESYLYLVDQLSVKAVYLIGDDLAAGEHETCIRILQSHNVHVEYPDGGIAVGQRFHYLQNLEQ